MIIHHVTKSEFGKLSGKVVDYKGQEAKIDGNNVYLTNDSKDSKKDQSFYENDVNPDGPYGHGNTFPEQESKTSGKRKSKS